MHAYRRGAAFEIETSRRDSPTLYGITRRAVASKGGEPGSRWHLLQQYRSLPRRYIWASDDDTYRTTHLHYGGVQDTRRDDTYRTPHLHYEGHEPRKPSSYQHRSAHGEFPKAGGNVLPATSDASTDGWRADGKPAEIFEYGEVLSRIPP